LNYSATAGLPDSFLFTLSAGAVRRGWAWLSSTRLRGVTVLRMMVMNYETRERHLRRLVADLEKLAGDPSVRREAAAASRAC